MVVTREPARQGHGEWEIGVGGIGERHVNFELLAGYNAIRKRLSGRIKAAIAVVLICVIIVLGSAPSIAGTLEDAAAAYKRGNYAAALQLYRSLADKGNAIAQDSLGDMYNYGKGVPQNQAEAEQWYRLAAKQGLAKAQNDLEKRRRFALCAPRVSHKETPRVARVHALIRL
ncbi:MAG: tetratricopeptide repeat protein [Rhodomicrobium sp.]